MKMTILIRYHLIRCAYREKCIMDYDEKDFVFDMIYFVK